MQANKNIITFSELGNYLKNPQNEETLQALFSAARNENAWFTNDFVQLALKNIAEYYLNEEFLINFTNKYNIQNPIVAKKVGLVMAGNVPAVGFHDLMCVVLSGNIALIKLSSNDSVIMRFLIQKLYELDNHLQNTIKIVDRLNDAEALIATGSDNTAKHFEYYFSNIPKIIRKNRTSVAVLSGKESKSDLANLGNDIFQYFGLGCRNVSKLYIPKGYDFNHFFEAIEYWSTIRLHHKYNNNYDYNKSIYLINKVPHFDNGFLLLKEDDALVSPISVCFYETYESQKHLEELLDAHQEKIQCIVSEDSKIMNAVRFGEAQMPQIDSFADGVDTMAFLGNI